MSQPQLTHQLTLCYSSFQACNRIELSCHLDAVAVRMRQDAMSLIKAVLSGTATGKLWDVLEGAFGYHEQDPPAEEVSADEEARDLPAEGTVTKGSLKRELAQETKRAVKRPKGCPRDPIPPAACQLFFPTMKGRHHYVGNPGPFISDRQVVEDRGSSSGVSRKGVYQCLFDEKAPEGVKKQPPCAFINESRPQLATHIREYHLGICLGCYVCYEAGNDWRVFSGRQWETHMKKHGLSEEAMFRPANLDLRTLLVKDEVTPQELVRAMQGATSVSTTETGGSLTVKFEVEPTPTDVDAPTATDAE